jgi:hypothetical protein
MGPRTYSTKEVAEMTGLAYQTVIAYRRQFPDLVPVERVGNRLRFQANAIDALKQLQESKMSGRLKKANADTVREHMLSLLKYAKKTTISLSEDLGTAICRLEEYRPSTSVWIHTLPEGPYRLKQPVCVLVERVAGTFVATLAEANLDASGVTWKDAIHRLRVLILHTLTRLKEESPSDLPTLGQLHVLRELTVPHE